MTTAKVTGWTDSRDAEWFEDEHRYEWAYYVDAADGTIAVNRADGRKAGIFTWDSESEDSGSIALCQDGDTYGVNCDGEFIVVDGEWTVSDAKIPV